MSPYFAPFIQFYITPKSYQKESKLAYLREEEKKHIHIRADIIPYHQHLLGTCPSKPGHFPCLYRANGEIIPSVV